jgi:predicted phosphodiesterase
MLDRTNNIDGYICLGDVVNYGPWSNECVELISSLENCIYIKGNHEEYFINGTYPGDNVIAKTFFDFCYPKFNCQDLIKDLPLSHTVGRYTFSHTIFNQYIYPDSDIVLDNNYVVGHSHHQFKISQPPFNLYNPGSVGQNRKYINIINYMVFNSDTEEFTTYALPYDVEIVINEMRRINYPQICIDYYNNKSRL